MEKVGHGAGWPNRVTKGNGGRTAPPRLQGLREEVAVLLPDELMLRAARENAS